MSCPFYGQAILEPNQLREGWTIFATVSGNRCGLITDAHSPCWMQVEEKREPEWSDCPRNPMFPIAKASLDADGRPHLRSPMERRWIDHGLYMLRLHRLHASAPGPTQ